MSDVVDDFLAHYGKKGMRWGVRNKRTASIDLTSTKTGQKKKIYYNPKKLDPNGPTVGNKRQISATRREGKNFQKQLNKASKELKPKAKDLSDEELRKAVNRMNMEKQYNSLIGNTSKKKKGAEFVKGIGTTAVKTALTAVVTQQVASALKKTGIAPQDKKK